MFFGVGLIARAVIFSQSKIKQLGITGEIYSGIITLGYLAGVLLGRRSGAWAPVKMAITQEKCRASSGNIRVSFRQHPRSPAVWHATVLGAGAGAAACNLRPANGASVLYAPYGIYFPAAGNALEEKNGYHSCNTGALELLVDDDYIVDGESYRAASEGGPLRITAAGPVTFLVAASANSGQ